MPNVKTPTFASAYAELETIAKEFEAGDIDLETSIPKFKRAVELSKLLRERLNQLENEIEEISLDLKEDTAAPPSPPSSASAAPLLNQTGNSDDSDDIPF